MKNSTNVFFNSILGKNREPGKLFTVPLSFTIHITLIGLILIYPLVNIGKKMPKPKIFSVKLFTMPGLKTPGIQISPGGGMDSNGEEEKNRNENISDNIAPLEIPMRIIDPEILPSTSNSNGIPGGIDKNLVGDFLNGSGALGDGNPSFTKLVSIVKSPVLLKRVDPIYPKLAIRSRVSGTVILEAVTNIYGKVINVRIVTGHPLLNEAAVNAVKRWLYEPYTINGIPKPVRFTVNVVFRLTTQK